MKAILLADDTAGTRNAYVIPDSSAGRNRQPLFLPDYREGLTAEIMVGVRISRLGKNIAPRFASRYYDALAPVCVLTPGRNAVWEPLFFARDQIYVAGEWIERARLESINPSGLTLSLVYVPARSANLMEDPAIAVVDNAFDLIDKSLSELSDGMTFKTGDLIFLPSGAKAEPRPDMRVICRLDGIDSLNFHFK